MLLVRARAFLRAIWSFLRKGDAPLALHDARMAACLACPHLDLTPTGLFCGACGCPRSPFSDLRTKWRLRDLACPRKHW